MEYGTGIIIPYDCIIRMIQYEYYYDIIQAQ